MIHQDATPLRPAPVNPYVLAVALAVLTVIPGLLLPEALTIFILGLLLFGIAAVYFGFAVMDGRRSALLIESAVVLGYLCLVTAGVLVSAWLLVLGYVLHGVWDGLHHNRAFGANIAAWYIPFCVVYDWLMAVFLAILLVT